jgi:hypothetical protein
MEPARHRTHSDTLYQDGGRARAGSEVDTRESGSMRSGRGSSRRQTSNSALETVKQASYNELVKSQNDVSVETLTGFLERIKLKNYVGLFDAAFIDLDAIMGLDDNDLKELGIKLSSHRQALINACAAYTKPTMAQSPGVSSPISPAPRKDREEFGNTERNRSEPNQEQRRRAR